MQDDTFEKLSGTVVVVRRNACRVALNMVGPFGASRRSHGVSAWPCRATI